MATLIKDKINAHTTISDHPQEAYKEMLSWTEGNLSLVR